MLMRKNLLLLSLLVVLLGSVLSAQDLANPRLDAVNLNLRGGVSSVDEDLLVKKAYFREDWPERKWFRDDLRNCLMEDAGHIYTFAPNGAILSHTYTLHGSKQRVTTYTYGKTGRMQQMVGEGYKLVRNGSNLDVYAESRIYSGTVDATSNLKTSKHTNDYAFDRQCRQEYTDEGLVLSSRYYYVDSTLAEEYVYSYNHRGQIDEARYMDYRNDANYPSKVVYRYTYDNLDCLAKMTVKGSSLNDIYTYENNTEGDPVKLTIVTPFGTTIYEYEYRYDDKNNWVMRLQFKDGVFENATLRTIRYHSKGTIEEIEAATVKRQQESSKALAKDEAKASKAKGEKTAKADKKVSDKPTKNVKADKSAKSDKRAKADKHSKFDKNAKTDESSKSVKKAKATMKDNNSKNRPSEVTPSNQKKAKSDGKKSDKKSSVEKKKNEKVKADKDKRANKKAKKVKAEKAKKAKADAKKADKKSKAEKLQKKNEKVKADKDKKATEEQKNNEKAKVDKSKAEKMKASKTDKQQSQTIKAGKDKNEKPAEPEKVKKEKKSKK